MLQEGADLVWGEFSAYVGEVEHVSDVEVACRWEKGNRWGSILLECGVLRLADGSARSRGGGVVVDRRRCLTRGLKAHEVWKTDD